MTAAALAVNSIALDMQCSEQASIIPEIGHGSALCYSSKRLVNT